MDYVLHCKYCPHRVFKCKGSYMGCEFMGKKSDHTKHEANCIYVKYETIQLKYQKLKPFEQYIENNHKDGSNRYTFLKITLNTEYLLIFRNHVAIFVRKFSNLRYAFIPISWI